MHPSQFLSSGRIDRRDLVQNRPVWLTFGLMFATFAVCVAGITVLWPNTFAPSRMVPLAIGLGIVAAVGLAIRPPRIDSWQNHVAVLAVSVCTALAVIAFAPTGVVPVAAAMFAGSFTASRLQSRWQLFAHYLAAGIILAIPVVLLPLDDTAKLALLPTIPALWVLGLCTILVLEAAEQQGEELERLVRRDPLTGVGNRRMLSERLAVELAAHERSGHPLSVIAFDLNGFKALNDIVGHDAGDAVLRRVAATLSQAVRPEDTVVRQGGDEFCLLLPQTSAAEAASLQAVIRAALADLRDDAVPITTGAGIASYPTDAVTATALLQCADDRLAHDKPASREVSGLAAGRAPALAVSSALAAMGNSGPLAAPATPHGPATAGFTRVSRREIALNRTVWLATGSMVVFFAVLCTFCAVMWPPANPVSTALPYCLFVAVVGALMLRNEPPRIGSWLNHCVVAFPYVASAVFVLAMPAAYQGGLIGALAFTGPLTAIRLVDRRQIAAHFLACGVLVLGLCVSGLVGLPMILALLLTVMVIWGIGFADIVYLEAAEAQGDELERLVRRDPLTGVGNRRLLAEQLDHELRRAGRTRKPLTVMALDLNGFKALNDDVGHAAGDELLDAVASCLTEIARGGDTVVRQGGDEFCLLLPETSPADAVPIENAVRAAIERIDAHGHRISTGVGTATFPTDAHSADVLMHTADARLRKDKLINLVRRKRSDAGLSPMRVYG